MIQEYSITSVADVPSLVYSFSASVGWNVSGTTTAPVLKHPSDANTIAFRLQSYRSGVDHRLYWDGNGNATVTNAAALRSPVRYVNSTLTVLTPTRAILIGSLSPKPFIAIVLAYGANLYRHLYFGHMEALGNYTGGECISGTGNSVSAVNSAASVKWYEEKYGWTMFSGYDYVTDKPSSLSGGVRVVHADNPIPWRKFYSPDWNGSNFRQDAAIGGLNEAYTNAYTQFGQAPFSGNVVLIPNNLLVTRPSYKLSPIGSPAGVRSVNVRDLEAESTLTIGSDAWKIFPVSRKSEATSANYGIDETSWQMGYAYKTN